MVHMFHTGLDAEQWPTYDWTLPAWVRVVLLLLTALSLLPEVKRMHRTGGIAHGLSFRYVGINLAAATEQFSICFLLVVKDNSPMFSNGRSVGPGDWLNLLQFAVGWMFWFGIFSCIILRSEYTQASKAGAIGLYLLFLYSGMGMILIEIQDELQHGPPKYFDLFDTFWLFAHLVLINPAIYILFTYVVFIQRHTIFAQPRPSGVDTTDNDGPSVTGMALQAAVSVVLAVTWPARVDVTSIDKRWWLYCLVAGWTTIFPLMYAAAQLLLLWTVLERKRKVNDGADHDSLATDEETSLLVQGTGI